MYGFLENSLILKKFWFDSYYSHQFRLLKNCNGLQTKVCERTYIISGQLKNESKRGISEQLRDLKMIIKVSLDRTLPNINYL